MIDDNSNNPIYFGLLNSRPFYAVSFSFAFTLLPFYITFHTFNTLLCTVSEKMRTGINLKGNKLVPSVLKIHRGPPISHQLSLGTVNLFHFFNRLHYSELTGVVTTGCTHLAVYLFLCKKLHCIATYYWQTKRDDEMSSTKKKF